MRSRERYSGLSAPALANFAKMAETESMKSIPITPTAIVACQHQPLIANRVFAQPR
jgi:preprotein translocase subunit Sec61beta